MQRSGVAAPEYRNESLKKPSLGLAWPSGIRIADDEQFAADLREYLDSPDPLPTCRHCLGTAGKRFAHAQVMLAQEVSGGYDWSVARNISNQNNESECPALVGDGGRQHHDTSRTLPTEQRQPRDVGLEHG